MAEVKTTPSRVGDYAKWGVLKRAQTCAFDIWRSYKRDEEGSLAIFGLFTFVMILVLGGIGVDIVRHEQLRTELQNTLDRAVLAAANLDSELDPEAVVTDYFAKAGLVQYLSDVRAETTERGRRVTAEVEATVPTYFMKFASVDRIELGSYATAEQGMTDLEIALVLDVSNSMNSYGRLGNLHDAGEDFTDIVFENSDPSRVRMSIVPYATQVNVGATLLDTMNRDDSHNNSHCLNFEASDYNSSALRFAGGTSTDAYQQTMVIDPWYRNSNAPGLILPVCDPASGNEVMAFSNNEAALKSKITNLQADGNTSIDVGVQWGAAMLNPANGALATAAGAAGYPLAYDSGSNLKVMLVMTDGVNTDQFYMPDDYRSGESDIYLSGNYASFPVERQVCQNYSYYYGYYNCSWQSQYYVPEKNSYYNSPYGSNPQLMDWDEVWERYTIDGHAYRRYKASGSSSDYYNWMDKTHAAVGNSTKNSRLLAACSAAKASGVLVFTIGFEAPADAESILKSCASSDAHYYDVDGLELSDAFSAIATKVTELRLTE